MAGKQTRTMIQVGTGGFGAYWCQNFLPPNIKDGTIEVVAAVDINEEALQNAKKHLHLRDDQLYTDAKKAFDENKADFCTVVVPPSRHEQIVDLALKHDMHILSEKPIADTLAGSIRIADKVKKAGKKMGVTMSHRFDQDKITLREELRSGKHGALDYIISRFTCFASWGNFSHEIPYTLIFGGAVHHLDIIADLAGAKCDTIFAQTWAPKRGEHAGDEQGVVVMQMENQTRGFYEAAKHTAIGMNGGTGAYFRAECEKATLIISGRRMEKFPYDPDKEWNYPSAGRGEEVPLLQQPKWANTWLIEKFVKWLDGDPAMETNVEDNLQSVALIFAVIESSRSGQPVKVQEFLAKARAEA